MEIKVTYASFVEGLADAVSQEQCIQATLDLLTNEGDYIVFEDGRRCFNEQELRAAIEEH